MKNVSSLARVGFLVAAFCFLFLLASPSPVNPHSLAFGSVCQRCPNVVVIAVSESVLVHTNLNGDGDAFDIAIHIFSGVPPLIGDLEFDVLDLALKTGLENQLLEILNTAFFKFSDSDYSDAIKALENFIAVVEKNKGKEISEADANALIAAARAILARV